MLTADISAPDPKPTEIYLRRSERSREYFDHIKKINDVFSDQIKLSDQKAAYIFTFMLALLVTSGEAKRAFSWTHYVNGGLASGICSAFLAAFSTFAVLCAVFTVLPRHFNKSTSLFWGTWPTHREAFKAAAHEGDVEYLFQQYVDNADILSSLAHKKFRCVKMAFWGLAGTVVSYVCALTFF